jgi:hypothetical protein
VNIPNLEEDLGIYDDVGDCDGLSDSELVEHDGDPKVKTPRRETPLAEKTKMTPIPILRKSSQLINSSNAPDWASGQRPIQYTPGTYSELDDQADIKYRTKTNKSNIISTQTQVSKLEYIKRYCWGFFLRLSRFKNKIGQYCLRSVFNV